MSPESPSPESPSAESPSIESPTTRLFVALTPPREAIERARRAVVRVRGGLPAARWVDPARWHVTLRFLGDTATERVPDLIERLDTLPAMPAPTLELSGAGTFPLRGRPAVLWIGLSGELARLSDLAAAVDRAVTAAGGSARQQKFRAHLTVARVDRRHHDRLDDLRQAVRELTLVTGPPFAADLIRLVRTHPDGRHETLHVTALAG